MILVTGGTGLIGSQLLHDLLVSGERVRALVRRHRDSNFRNALFNCFDDLDGSKLMNLEWFEGDVLDIESLKEAMHDVSQVYHCGGMISFRASEAELMKRINIDGTANIVEACLTFGVQKLVYTSSISVLGSHPGTILNETAEWTDTGQPSAYGYSKYYAEQEVWKGIKRGLNAAIVIPSLVLGAGSHPETATVFLRNIRKILPYYTIGVTGYVDVRDVSAAMILLMKSNISSDRFILNAENLSQKELFTACAAILGLKGPAFPLYKPLLSCASYIDKYYSRITGKEPSLTKENVLSVFRINRYSADKFCRTFDYTFIPVEESLKHVFMIMKLIPFQREYSQHNTS
jgi:dihydroflavonol-4-reductase